LSIASTLDEERDALLMLVLTVVNAASTLEEELTKESELV
jgi:hypothetical protein